MPTLNATAKSASANSYVTVADADTYHDERLHNSEWSSASTDDKERALIWSTELLEANFLWYGYRYSEEQALDWPRSEVYNESGYILDNETIPEKLKNATATLAYLLILSDRTRIAGDSDQDGLKSLGLGNREIEIEFDPNNKKLEVPTFIENLLSNLGRKKAGSTRSGINSGVASLQRS